MTGKALIEKEKGNGTVRFLTFNVNGIRTFFHYHPFSGMNQSLTDVFDYFKADIVTFQELKTDRQSMAKWGKVPGFFSFISIPQLKKGYSGVGCWVRIYPEEHPLHDAMHVLKAEEGITGMLTVKIGKMNVRYRDDPNLGIGGYDSLGIGDTDEREGLKLDSEGRCVMIELACNIVVVNVYCPANSTLSEEGQSFRIKFLGVLFKRIRNLDKMGKKVVLMGDLNICRDLCDHAESLEREEIVTNDEMGGLSLERSHKNLCEMFVLSPDSPHRRMLNQMLGDSIIPTIAQNGILIDTTRLIQSRRRLKMYTVWNTLKNTRPVNYGSRIDFILAGLSMKGLVEAADILPQVMGSDHCPVFADLNLLSLKNNHKDTVVKLPRFEARHKYGLTHGNIIDMFGKNQVSNFPTAKSRVTKKQGGTRGKFNVTSSSLPDSVRIEKIESHQNVFSKAPDSMKQSVNRILGEPPICKHGLPAILRTSKTAANPGKRFWICKQPHGSSGDESSSCGFFQWL